MPRNSITQKPMPGGSKLTRQQKRAQARVAQKKLTVQVKPGIKKARPKNSAVFKNTMSAAQFNRDPRRVQTSDASLALSSQQQTVPQIYVMNLSGFQGFCAAFITKAFERGFAGSEAAPWLAFFAYNYMNNILVQFATGGTPSAQQLPYFLLAIGRAISKKTVPFKLSKMSFAAQSSWFESDTDIVIGFPSYGKKWTMKTVPVTPAFVNMFPLVTDVGWPAYDDASGQNAFTSLCAFMENNSGDLLVGKLCRSVPVATTKTSLDSDVSTFAVVRQSQGIGWTGTNGGGIQCVAELEVPLFNPLLALLNANPGVAQVPFAVSRSAVHTIAVSGDCCFLGLSMSSFLSEKEWGIKKYPYFKAVDFLEFGDVVAQWMTSITQAFINDSANESTWSNVSPALQQSLPCPLTLQEVLLLLRNVMMQAFKDTQSGVSGLSPYAPASAIDNQFVPFIAGSATCFLSAIDMNLPIPLIENIRALVTRKVAVTDTNVQLWVPVLGQYVLSTLNSSDYQITFPKDSSGAGPTSRSIFTSGALFRSAVKEEVSTKARSGSTSSQSSSTVTLAEQPISLIDGSCTPGIAAINDPGRLKVLCSLWNDWLTGSGVQTYSVSCGTLGTEKGISVLASVPMTRHFVRITPSHVEARQRVMMDIRMETLHAKRMVNTPYSLMSAVADTSHGVILAAPYEQILSTWILPINEVEFSNDPANSTALVRFQSIMGEGALAPLTSGTDGQLMSTMHATYAAKMTKGRTAEKSDWTTLFETMAVQGRGGVLSSLVAGLVGNFVPGLGGIANTIANALPI